MNGDFIKESYLLQITTPYMTKTAWQWIANANEVKSRPQLKSTNLLLNYFYYMNNTVPKIKEIKLYWLAGILMKYKSHSFFFEWSFQSVLFP